MKYANAKVLLLGHAGVGKTGLGIRLGTNRFEMTGTTHGLRIWKLSVPADDLHSSMEIYLWDPIATVGYRELESLYYNDVALGLFLYDHNDRLHYDQTPDSWFSSLAMVLPSEFPSILVAARIDMSPSHSPMPTDETLSIFGFMSHIQTSARTGEGCDMLKEKIYKCIDWTQASWSDTTNLHDPLRQEILHLRDSGNILITFDELHERLGLRCSNIVFSKVLLNSMITQLSIQCVLRRLAFEDYLLLYPSKFFELAYAILWTSRKNPLSFGVLEESSLLDGTLEPDVLQTLDQKVQRILVQAIIQEFKQRSICAEVEGPYNRYLIFPKASTKEQAYQRGCGSFGTRES
jgi:GTPase SAR1 family protein